MTADDVPKAVGAEQINAFPAPSGAHKKYENANIMAQSDHYRTCTTVSCRVGRRGTPHGQNVAHREEGDQHRRPQQDDLGM